MTKKPARTIAVIAVGILWWAGSGYADEPQNPGLGNIRDIEQLDLATLLETPVDVWTAAKTEQKNTEAPAIITTVTREQIAVWGYRSVADLLGHLLGFFVIDDHTTPNVAVRGVSGGLHADSSIVKVLIDGQSVAFLSTGGNWLGPELIPLSAIERVEVVRGPASSLFGADAFLGVINIKTRSGSSLNGGTVSLGGGVAGQKLATDVDLAAGGEKGPVDALLAARYSTQDLSGLALPSTSPAPSIPSYNRGATSAHGLDQRSLSAMGRVTYRPRQGTELGLFGYYSSMRRGAEFGALYQLANGRDSQNDPSGNLITLSQMRGGLFLDQSLGESLRLSVRGAAFRGGPGDDNRLEVGSEYYYVKRQFGFRGGDLDAQIEWTTQGRRFGDLRLAAGGSALLDDELLPSRIAVAKTATAQTQTGGVIDAISAYQGRKTFLNTGAYLQGMWNPVADLLGVTGGLRYDEHNIYGGQLSERVGLVSSPLPSLHAKLLYGKAFKAPSPLLLYAMPSAIGDVTGNPQLKPQFVRTVEFQIAADPAEFLGLSSSVAYSVLNDKTEFVQQGINNVARNVARLATLSWETMAELKHRIVRAHASFETQRTVRRADSEDFASSVVGSSGEAYPVMMVHSGLVVQPPRLPLRGMVQASYIGTRRASDINILLNGAPYTLPAYVLVEAGLSTSDLDLFGSPRHAVSFALTGKNLLNAVGPNPGFGGVDYPLAPRTFFLQMNVGL
jgi:iron complex outermembrane receptor protein